MWKLPDVPNDLSDFFNSQLGRWLESDKLINAFEIGYFDDHGRKKNKFL